ncbi:response regulator [Jeotgalibacillus sp. S-D1]|nr:response regulator [Jeotgalibacillus sp. S-D1]
MNVMITDDEVQVRKGLRMKVDWEEHGFKVVKEASNGQEALQILEQSLIDVVITDMRMPIMNGIEFAKQSQKNFPNVKVVVLSGYSDYEYVRNSMKEGVKDYLLKPVAPDELVEVLEKIRKEIAEEKQTHAEQERLKQLALSHLQEVQEQYLLYLAKDEFVQPHAVKERMRQLQLDHLAREEMEGVFLTVEIRTQLVRESISRQWLPFKKLCQGLAASDNNTYLFSNPSYSNVIHFFIVRREGQTGQVTSLIDRIQRKTKEELGLETVIGIGTNVRGMKEFKNGYIASMLSWSQSRLGSHSQIIEGGSKKDHKFEFSTDFEKKLTNAIENTRFDHFKEHLQMELSVTEKHSVLSFSMVANRVLFLLGSTAKKYDIESGEIQKILWDCQQGIWQLNSQSNVIGLLLDLANKIMDEVHLTRFSNVKLIESIRQYVNLHFSDEISLTALSELFHINSAHLSETFKNHVGQNFSDYLVSLRMKKAESLLKDSQLKIIDIANLVGFSSAGYFSTVFKKYSGQSPLEFRKLVNEGGTLKSTGY